MWTNEYQPEKYKFQVLLSVYNAEKHLNQCLKSLDDSLSSYEWILLYGDDESSDQSLVELAKCASELTCDKIHLYEFDKAKTVGQAKNRLVKEMHNFKKDYPYILFMDADDQMLPERPRMAATAEAENSKYVVGGWERIKKNQQDRFKAQRTVNNLGYGPWATLFHADFFTEDEPFFPEDEVCNTGYEDVLTWNHLRYIEKIEPVPHSSDDPVHRYFVYDESTCHSTDINLLNYRRNTFWGISDLMKDNQRNIYTNPVSRKEADEALAAYKARKSQSKAKNPLSND